MKSQLFRKFNWPHIALAILMLGLTGLGSTQPAHAGGVFISAPNRADMVHDPIRNILYITSGGEVLRYDLCSQRFFPSFQLGGRLAGIDLSPDGNTLAVADSTSSADSVWFHLVNLQNGASQKVTFVRGLFDGPTFSVAFGSDGNLLITEAAQWSPLRKYNPLTGATTTLLPLISGATVLSSSADGSVIGFAESNISDGRWGRYRVSDGNIVERIGYTDGTGNYNYEITTNRNGTQFAIPTFVGTFVYNSDFARIAFVWQQPAGALQPFGGVYDPTKDILYLSWGGTQEVRAFETTNFTQVATFNFGSTFNIVGTRQTYETGHLKISRDGALLFAVVDGGISYVYLGGGTDKTPPVVSITSPQAKDYLHTATFNVTWNACDSASGLASQSGRLNSTPVTNGQLVDLFFLSLGPHTVSVSATDFAGNSATASVTFNVVTNIDSLIAEKDRACSLGWINDPNVCKSLDAKLKEAKDAILRGQTNTAKSKLNDFIDQLEAQLGKGVNQLAFNLLKASALYIINHLP